MNRLSTEKRAMILRALVEGNSIRATCRMTGASKNTVTKMVVEFGEACSAYQSDVMRDLPCTMLELDEIWTFVGCKEGMKKRAKGQHPGDVWTWTAIDADTKLIPGWFIGDRSAGSANAFCADLADRFSGELQVNTDGLQSYRFAVPSMMGAAHHARLVKIYGKDPKTGREVVTGIKKEVGSGTPDMTRCSTSYVERQNLTMRMHMRRFTRLTNAFSKKLENHAASVSLHFMYYNFCRVHQTLKTTPAVKAGVADKVWSVEDIVEMFDTYWKENHPVQRPERYKTQKATPKTIEPRKAPEPWYLQGDSKPDDTGDNSN